MSHSFWANLIRSFWSCAQEYYHEADSILYKYTHSQILSSAPPAAF